MVFGIKGCSLTFRVNRGMGGNQAMHDCADILPHLLELNDIAATGRSPTGEEISSACAKYESAMIERAFTWVSKSGGASMPVRERSTPTEAF